MKVGAYVDGLNMYYGARGQCGVGTPGWRWIDIRSLVSAKLPTHWINAGAIVDRVVYCTSRPGGHDDPDLPNRHDAYLRALEQSDSVDHIEFGTLVRGVRASPLATFGKERDPEIVRSRWPVMVKNSKRADVADAQFMVSHLHTEEKGSDVNVATHMLVDVLLQRVDAVVVVSNDSDFQLPLSMAREWVPVGLLNPGGKPLAGRLKDDAAKGVGHHWWSRIERAEYFANQLPRHVGTATRPTDW